MASSTVEVRWRSCSSIKSGRSGSSSDNYIIDPDGNGGVTPFSVYCDMSDKGGVGVTVISHDSESRTHVGNIPGWGGAGCVLSLLLKRSVSPSVYAHRIDEDG